MQWRVALVKEIRTHQKFCTFVLMVLQFLPRGVKVHRLVTTFSYKTNVHRFIIGYKARLSFPGNRLWSDVDFNLRDLAVHSAGRAVVSF